MEYILFNEDNEIDRGFLENIGHQWQELVLDNLTSNTEYTLIMQETFVYEGVQYSFITRYYFFTTKP